MLRADLAAPPVLAGLHEAYRAAKLPFVVVPDAIAPPLAEELRAAVEPTFTRFEIIDRGRYHASGAPLDPALAEELQAMASAIAGAPLALGPARWLRFGRGDYALMRDDQATRAPGRNVELTCDLSALATEQGEIVYSDGKETVVVPQWPGALVVVDKPPSLYRYERYLTHTVGERRIYRLRVLLQYR